MWEIGALFLTFCKYLIVNVLRFCHNTLQLPIPTTINEQSLFPPTGGMEPHISEKRLPPTPTPSPQIRGQGQPSSRHKVPGRKETHTERGAQARREKRAHMLASSHLLIQSEVACLASSRGSAPRPAGAPRLLSLSGARTRAASCRLQHRQKNNK